MAESQTAKAANADQQTDSAKGPAGDSALKAIAHLQQVAETLAADAAKLTEDKCEETKAKDGAAALPVVAERAAETPKPGSASAPGKDWRTYAGALLEHVAWSQAAAAAVMMLVVGGGAYLGLMDYLDRKETQRMAAEEALRHPPETLAERELRGKIAELTLDLQSLRAQMSKIAGEARLAQTQSAAGAAAAQNVARVEKLEKELAAKLDGQVARVERLERLAADPIVTSSIAKDQKAQHTTAVPQTSAKSGLRTPDPSMKPNTFVLRSVRNGVAMVQTRRGMLEVGPGDTIPGVGRVRAIEKLDGRWVLVMHEGYIDQDDD